jgi:hypothetical protein
MRIGGKGTATDTAGRNNSAKKKEKKEEKEKDAVKRQWSLADKRKHSEVRVKKRKNRKFI